MRIFGLAGYPLEHSFSPAFFQQKFKNEGITDSQYLLFPMKNIDGIRAFVLSHPEICGLNVTSPHKESILPFLDEWSEEVRAVHAANTIGLRRTPEGVVLKGYNTDIIGFKCALAALECTLPSHALIFGTGGASHAAAYVLEQQGIHIQRVSRSPHPDTITYNDLDSEILRSHRLWVQSTPIGTYPQVEEKLPLTYKALTPGHILIDMIYNPSETAFLREGRIRGCRILNGLSMLHGQAEASWEIWNSCSK